MHIFNVITAGTRTVMREYPSMEVTGPPDYNKDNVEKTACKEICMNNSRCVTVMHDGTQCFIYYTEKTESTQATNTVYKKVEETSTGALTCDITLYCLIFCYIHYTLIKHGAITPHM